MVKVDFTKAERDAIIKKIQAYCAKEMDQEISPFEAGFLLKFFVDEVGPYFYNTALRDAQAVLNRRMEEILNGIDELTRPVGRPKRVDMASSDTATGTSRREKS
jgi:uncharacterized protein (DUF2164 family)